MSMPAPRRKPPNIWALASVTYGAVIAVTVASVLAYYYLAPKGTQSASDDGSRLVSVGSVWMPLYPGATIASTASTKQGSGTESTLNFETTEKAELVLSFYQAALKKGVFRFGTVTQSPGGGTVQSFVHDGKTTVAVTVQSTGGGSRGEIRTRDKDTRD